MPFSRRTILIASAALVALVLLSFIIYPLSFNSSGELSPAELQMKLDSIHRLEAKERLAAQGIHLDREVSPVQLFYDSLEIQPLPIRYSEEYVTGLPNYKTVPAELASFMGLLTAVYEIPKESTPALPDMNGIIARFDEVTGEPWYLIYDGGKLLVYGEDGTLACAVDGYDARIINRAVYRDTALASTYQSFDGKLLFSYPFPDSGD